MNVRNNVDYVKKWKKMIKWIKNLFKGNQPKASALKPPFYLNNKEFIRMKEMGSNTVRMTSVGGIGIKVEARNKNAEWIDITDYTTW